MKNIDKLYAMLHADRARRICLKSKAWNKSCNLGCPFNYKDFRYKFPGKEGGNNCMKYLEITLDDCGEEK